MSDEQWQRLVPLLPAKDHRTIINGILWVPGVSGQGLSGFVETKETAAVRSGHI